jgi:hypothetical protein
VIKSNYFELYGQSLFLNNIDLSFSFLEDFQNKFSKICGNIKNVNKRLLFPSNFFLRRAVFF